jgi:transposase
MAKYSLTDFRREFPTDDACLAYLFAKRWGQHGPVCTCGKRDSFHKVAGRRTYACAWCGAQLSPAAGTIFDHSPTPLTLWFYAMFLMCASKNGVAAKELQRQLGVTYKTAWRMAHAIRKLMDDGPGPGRLRGTVEGDETYIGGRRRGGKRGRGAPGKTPVVGLVERGGEVRAKVLNRVTTAEVFRYLYMNVEEGATVYTDELAVYNYAQSWGYHHDRVHHASEEYVRGPVHTNTIEGFWSQLKRSLDGTYHHVSARHLHRYVGEFAWRYNRRRSSYPLFLSLAARSAASRAVAA